MTARRCLLLRGSIPAQAGKPDTTVIGVKPAGVYPRTGGETSRYQVIDFYAMLKNVDEQSRN